MEKKLFGVNLISLQEMKRRMMTTVGMKASFECDGNVKVSVPDIDISV